MKKRLVSVLCIISLLIVWLTPKGTYAASHEPERLPSSTPDFHGDWLTGELSGIRVDSADEALALLTRDGRKTLGLSAPAPEYVLKDMPVDTTGRGKSYQFQQTYHGIPIYGMIRIVNTDTNGYVQAISGDDDTVVAGMSLPTKPVLTGAEAIDAAIAALGLADPVLERTESELCYFGKPIQGKSGLYHLTYRVVLSGCDETGALYWVLMVDALDGEILQKTDHKTVLQIGGAYGKGVLGDTKSFIVSRGSGSPYWEMVDYDRSIECVHLEHSYTGEGCHTSKDTDRQWYRADQGPEVDGYYYMQKTYDYFYGTFGFDSFDGAGKHIKIGVHYGIDEVDAFWDGSGFYFGDGWAPVCLPLSGAPDVVAHEYTHAITDYSAGLEYNSISGALNEAFSDIFGALVENAPDDTSFYWIAERIWRDGPALRDMAHPSQYGMPEKMSQYQHIGIEDWGGVHVNCSIPCKAFYIMGQSLGREQLANIWFSALREYLTPYSDFWDAREATVQAAAAMYGASAASVVAYAWDSAGVTAVNPDTYGDTLDRAVRYNYGDTVAGSIDWAGDLDCFVFTPTANGTYDFYTTGSTDTFGMIIDPTGENADDDNLGDGYNFRVSKSLQKGHTYYVVVCHADEYGHGGYTLRSSTVIDPVTSMSVTVSPSPAGEIKTQVTVRASAGPETAEYLFQVKKSNTSRWTTLQSYRENNAVGWAPDTPGIYDIRVRARSVGRTSDYDLERLVTYEVKDIPNLTGVVLETDGATVRENCTRIPLTAIPQGEESETCRGEYQFLLRQGKKWTIVQSWNGDNTYEWTPTKTGVYTLEVQARTQGRSGVDAGATEDFEIVYPKELEGVELTAEPGSSSERDTDITLAAAASGEQRYRAEYLFRLKSGKRWSTLRDWGPETYIWRPAKTGCYTLEVQARTIGRPAADKTASTEYTVSDIYPLEEVKISSSGQGMQPAEKEIRLSVAAEGPHADNAEYLYQYSTDGRKWRSIGDGKWTDSPWAPFTPKSDAVYQFRVQARSPGRSGVDVADTISQRFYIGPMPVEDVSLTVLGPADIQETGKTVKLTAEARGEAAGEAEYLYRVKLGKRWTTLRDWDSEKGYDWKPDREGAYTIEVLARTQGRNGPDAVADTPFTVVNVFPLTGVTLTGTPSGMREAGTEITLNAVAAGPYADNAEYAFQYSLDGKKWYSIRKGFNPGSEITYTPAKEAVYRFRVQARSAGRSGVDEEDIFSQRFYVGAMPVESVSLEIEPSGTQEVERTATLRATACGDAAADAQYLFRVKLGRKWTTVQDWGDTPTYAWTPKKTGTYTVEVQARNRGRKGTDAVDTVEAYTVILPSPLDGVTLRADRESPQEIMTGIILTAAAQGDESETSRGQYLFLAKMGRRWSTLQDWSANGICLWTPDKTGTYTIAVQARTAGRLTADTSAEIEEYEIGLPDALTSVELNASEVSPAKTGTGITLSAKGKIGEAEIDHAQYLFRVKLGKRWSTLQNWSEASCYTWEPEKTGTYTIEVQARTAGRPTMDTSAVIEEYIVELPEALTSVELNASAASPAKTGTSITFRAKGKVGENEIDHAQYLFRMKLGKRWSTLQNWSEESSYTWRPEKTGTYTIEVQARMAGRPTMDTSAVIEEYEVELPDALTSVELSASEVSPAETGTGITFRAKGKIGENEIDHAQYLFRMKLGKRWSTLQNWSEEASCTWEPDKTGPYLIEVQARTVGRPSADVNAIISPYEIELPDALTSVELSASEASPAKTGTGIILSAKGKIRDAETDHAQYLFRVKLGSKWTTLRDWGAGTYTWEPTKTGTYTIEVQARAVGRPTADVKTTMYPYETELPDALTSVELSASEVSPAETGTGITFSAKSKIGEAEIDHAQYLFRVKLGKRWSTLQNWSEEASYTWEPNKTGAYIFEVQARAKGRSSIDANQTMTYTITDIVPIRSVAILTDPEYGVVDESATITAAADRPNAEYRFLCGQADGPYELLQEWSGDADCEWIPEAAGEYTLLVLSRARQQNSVQAVQTQAYRILAVPPVREVTVGTNPEDGQELGGTVEITAHADQPDASYEFAYSLDGSDFIEVQGFSSDASLTWEPDATGVYTWRVRARTDESFPQGQAESVITYRVYTEVAIPDAALRDGLKNILGKTPDDIITNLDMATLTDLDCSGWGIEDLTGIEYAVNVVTLDLSENRIHDLAPLQSLIDNGGLAGTGSQLDITLNGLDGREGTPVKTIFDSWTDTGIELAYLPQHSIVGNVALATDIESPGDAGTVIHLLAQSDQPGVEYRFSVDEDILSEWTDADTLVWTPDTAGVYTITVQARTWGMPETEVTDSIQYEILPAPLSAVSIGAVPDASIEEGNTVTLSAASEAGAWYRFQVMGEDGECTSIGEGWSQSNTIEWVPESAGEFTLCVQAHRDGRPADGIDASDTMAYRVIPLPIMGDLDIAALPESPLEAGTEITMSINNLGPEAEYWFGVQTAEETWVWTGEWGAETSASWTPDSAGIYVLTARSRALGRDGYDLKDTLIYMVTPSPVGAVSLSIEPESPHAVGVEVMLTAESEGTNPEYCFSVKAEAGDFEDIEGWTESKTVTWIPDAPGTYTLRVQARESGQSAATAEASALSLVAWPSLESLALEINETVTYQYEPRQLTATANTDYAEFKFSVQNPDGSWSTLQGWSEDSACEWIPSTAGEYVLQVEGRGLGRIGSDCSDTMTVPVYPSPPMREWSAYFGGSGMDESKAVRQTSDGGYILAGYTRSTDVPGYKDPNGKSDAYLVKTDSMGNMQWQFCRGGNQNDVFRDVIETVDGGFLAVGQKVINSDAYVYIVKVNAQGYLDWEDWYGGSGNSDAYAVSKTMDGKYCVTGYVCDTGLSQLSGLAGKKISTGVDGFILKIDGNGEPVWLKYYGGNGVDKIYDIIQSSDGSIICVGETQSSDLNNHYHGRYDGWVLKTNSSGILQWHRAIGGSNQDCFFSASIRRVAGQERYEIVGVTQSNDGDVPESHGAMDGYYVSISPSGSMIYNTLCLGGSDNDQLKDIMTTEDQGLMVIGYSTSKDGSLSDTFGNGLGWMVRINIDNQVLWQKRLYDMFGGEGYIFETNDRRYIIAGSCQNSNKAYGALLGSNFLLVKMSSEGVMMPFFAEMAFDHQSPQVVGTSITVTGRSNLADVEYRFLYYDEAGTETILQDWSTDASVGWTPNTAGSYVIKMQARMPQYAQYIETDIVKFNIQ